MYKAFKPSVSVEDFAAYLDGNLTQEGMDRIKSIVNSDEVMRSIDMSNRSIDEALSDNEFMGIELPDELSSLDFDIPDIEILVPGDMFFDNDALYHQNNFILNTMSEEYDDLSSHRIFGEEGLHTGSGYNPYVQQAYDDTCAIRSQQIIMRDYGVDISEHDLRDIASEHGWYSSGCGTSISDVGNLLDLVGIHCHQSMGNTVYDLVSELSQGHRVIVGVDSGELWSKTFMGKTLEKMEDFIGLSHADHALIVAGVDVNVDNPKDIKIVLTDPGSGDLRIEYQMKDFLDAWKDSKCFMVSTDIPAPFQFDATTGREVPSGFHTDYSHNAFVLNHGYPMSPEAMTILQDYETTYSEINSINWGNDDFCMEDGNIMHDNHGMDDSDYDSIDDIDL